MLITRLKRSLIDFHLDKVYPFLVRPRNLGNESLNTERSFFKNETEQDEDLDKDTQSQDFQNNYHQRDTR